MDIIHLLPDSVANQIAAGEVIQRPSSVIKELMENSVDAGATSIDVWVTDAGKTNIQVIDNGKGMSETDARLSFERHATSKIQNASDLFGLRTMGFRGEALASIAAVAQVELKTRTKEDELGVCISVEGSRITGQKPVACNVGANFSVKNLFYNVPARRRFLKSNTTELNNIMSEFERVALIHPEISFTFHRDDTLALDLRPSSFRKRITSLFGTNLDKQLLPVQVETSLVKIEGFVGVPESARAKGVRQFFFINGRFMRHSYFNRAIMNAFERLIPADKQVPYFYCLEVEPSRIDVNIHPTKTEIKFEDDQAIWQVILAATKEALGRFNAMPTIDFTETEAPEIPIFNPETQVVSPQVGVDCRYTPFHETHTPSYHRGNNTDKWEDLYASLKKTTSTAVPKSEEKNTSLYAHRPDEEAKEWNREQTVYYQYKGKYIFTSVKSGLMVIDQHRAHVRILYDKLLQQIKERKVVSQGLLFTELIQIPVSQAMVFNEHISDLESIGFEISALGSGKYAVNGIPAGSEKQDVTSLVNEIFEIYVNKDGLPQDKVCHHVALALARKNAIGTGVVLAKEEMKKLVDDLFSCELPNYSPDGKPTLAIVPNDKIESLLR